MIQKINIWLCSDYKNLEQKLDGTNCITVEAEYGDYVVKGSLATFAHHGERKHNPCPCLYANKQFHSLTDIGISHLDLDTVGGVLAASDNKFGSQSFWDLAAFIDLKGSHKISTYDRFKNALQEFELINQMNAWYQWAETNRVIPTAEPTNVYDWFIKAEEALHKIFDNEYDIIKEGIQFANQMKDKNFQSLIMNNKDVCLRSSPDYFVNSFYENLKEGTFFKSIVGYNPKTKSITLSFFDETATKKYNVDASKIMKELFGADAGGHTSIAGTPRNKVYELIDAKNVVDKVTKLLKD